VTRDSWTKISTVTPSSAVVPCAAADSTLATSWCCTVNEWPLLWIRLSFFLSTLLAPVVMVSNCLGPVVRG